VLKTHSITNGSITHEAINVMNLFHATIRRAVPFRPATPGEIIPELASHRTGKTHHIKAVLRDVPLLFTAPTAQARASIATLPTAPGENSTWTNSRSSGSTPPIGSLTRS
jgi:hypothetical protein